MPDSFTAAALTFGFIWAERRRTLSRTAARVWAFLTPRTTPSQTGESLAIGQHCLRARRGAGSVAKLLSGFSCRRCGSTDVTAWWAYQSSHDGRPRRFDSFQGEG
jgi:hypothetical protein